MYQARSPLGVARLPTCSIQNPTDYPKRGCWMCVVHEGGVRTRLEPYIDAIRNDDAGHDALAPSSPRTWLLALPPKIGISSVPSEVSCTVILSPVRYSSCCLSISKPSPFLSTGPFLHPLLPGLEVIPCVKLPDEGPL
jgi:hypothetical protein